MVLVSLIILKLLFIINYYLCFNVSELKNRKECPFKIFVRRTYNAPAQALPADATDDIELPVQS